MKRISWSQLTLELDRLFFGGHIADMDEAQERADTIEAYLEACGWTWDLVLEEMCREETSELPAESSN